MFRWVVLSADRFFCSSPVVVFLDRGRPCFLNVNSTIPVDAVRVKSYIFFYLKTEHSYRTKLTLHYSTYITQHYSTYYITVLIGFITYNLMLLTLYC